MRCWPRPRLKGALHAISAAVVGVILNLSVWFALHVLFATVLRQQLWPAPELAQLNLAERGFVILAAGLLIGRRWPVMPVLAVMALLACAAS